MLVPGWLAIDPYAPARTACDGQVPSFPCVGFSVHASSIVVLNVLVQFHS